MSTLNASALYRMTFFLVLCSVYLNHNLAAEPEGPLLSVRLRVTSKLSFSNVPFDPKIDFPELIKQSGHSGVLDANSIIVVDLASNNHVPHALTEDFAYGDIGRVEWVITEPTHLEYEIRFRTVKQKTSLIPAKYTPQIGAGDLLRYNAGVPRQIAPAYLSRLMDIDGDGQRDLLGCWNYAYRPGWPWDGVIAFPRVDSPDKFEFGDLKRIRYVNEKNSQEFHFINTRYTHADFADLNRDGLVDMVCAPSREKKLFFYLNTGRKDASGMPVFFASGSIPRQTSHWNPCRAIDLNDDAAIDFVIGNTYLKNINPQGWPIQVGKAVQIKSGKSACFYDVDRDGLLDAVCLTPSPNDEPRDTRVGWKKNLGGDSIQFGKVQRLAEITVPWCTGLAAVTAGPRRGILVMHDVFQAVSFYEQRPDLNDQPRFQSVGRAVSDSAVLTCSDQAWPSVCDWDGDGDLDLLIGGGYGWPRIVINRGTKKRPAYDTPKRILSNGQPIRFLRDEILGGKHGHNMGYPYPNYVDWDADGLPDLVVPNETNRIFWYKNIGSRQNPQFGSRQQIVCDDYPDTPESITESARLASDKTTPNQPYPYEKNRPFFWRTGAAFSDINGDGLTDLVTHDGFTRKATLFTQYRDSHGTLRLKKDRPLKLVDGRLIDDQIVGRTSHWTESFKIVDWDGDQKPDLIYTCAGSHSGNGSIYLLQNVGEKTNPVYAPPRTLCCFGKPIKVTNHGPHPWVGDLDHDGRPDILTCVEWSVFPFFSHAAVEMKFRPTWTISPVQKRE